MVGGEPGILHRFKLLESHLDDGLTRLVAAAEAEALGARGISLVSRSTGVSRRAIRQGLQELREAEPPKPSGPHRIRRAGGGRRQSRKIPPYAPIWSSSWSRRSGEIRHHRCAGLAEACGSWHRNYGARVTRSRTSWSARSSMSWAIACRRTARLLRELITRIEMLSSRTSTGELLRICEQEIRSSLSIPRRRSWSGTTRTADENGGQRESQRKFLSTTS